MTTPDADRHGRQRQDGGKKSHHNGAKACRCCFADGLVGRNTFKLTLIGKVNKQHAVVHRHAYQEDGSHERLHIERGAGQIQHPRHTNETKRHRQHNDTRPDP